jgi:signal transduction histidine kinase
MEDIVSQFGPVYTYQLYDYSPSGVVSLAGESDNVGSAARDLLGIHDSKLRAVARCLHDDLGQLLAALSMHLHLVNNSRTTRPDLTPCLEIAQQAIQRVRELAADLYPSMLEDLTLPDALRCWLDERARRSGVTIDLLTSASWNQQPTLVEITCFRAVTEAVENAISRVATKRICVELRQDAETVEIAIHDDGQRLEPDSVPTASGQPPQKGMEAVCRRIELLGGLWRIESSAGQGSTVHVHLPVDPDAASSGNRKTSKADS